jgi:hypothetical protein
MIKNDTFSNLKNINQKGGSVVIFVTIVLTVIIIGGIYYFIKKNDHDSQANQKTETNNNVSGKKNNADSDSDSQSFIVSENNNYKGSLNITKKKRQDDSKFDKPNIVVEGTKIYVSNLMKKQIIKFSGCTFENKITLNSKHVILNGNIFLDDVIIEKPIGNFQIKNNFFAGNLTISDSQTMIQLFDNIFNKNLKIESKTSVEFQENMFSEDGGDVTINSKALYLSSKYEFPKKLTIKTERPGEIGNIEIKGDFTYSDNINFTDKKPIVGGKTIKTN